jgi:hypothetical protein
MLARSRIIVPALIAGLALAGCTKPSDAPADATFPFFGGHGRFLGVGIYTPGTAWTQIVDAQRKVATSYAQLVDDQAVIVVEDSRTGEIRACGDLTGYCIGMNPWKTALVQSRTAPIKLMSHAGDTDRHTAGALSGPLAAPDKAADRDPSKQAAE